MFIDTTTVVLVLALIGVFTFTHLMSEHIDKMMEENEQDEDASWIA